MGKEKERQCGGENGDFRMTGGHKREEVDGAGFKLSFAGPLCFSAGPR